MTMLLWIALCCVALFSAVTCAADVKYAVIAFPQASQTVGVSVGGQVHPLQPSPQHPNLFVGTAPFADSYQYVIDNQPEATHRKLDNGATSTGNEFFNRSRTIYNVPDLPQAYNPFYPTLFTGMNRSNEVATIILQVNPEGLQQMLQNPKTKMKDLPITQMAYIGSQEVHVFSGAGFSTSGQSTKDFAKQSYKIDINKYVNDTEPKSLLFGRTAVKLRAQETDMTMAREKLVLDFLGASGAATLSGSWVRLYVNNEPFGLYLMIDDVSTHLIDDVLHAGDWKNPTTGPTWKGNAMSPELEGNLAYLGDDPTLYSNDIYKLEDKGEDKTIQKNASLGPLIGFLRDLNAVDPSKATDAQNPGDFVKLMNPKHTLVHMAINFLTGSWDGFWYQASNYFLNQDMQSKQWTLITYDFDETFGCNAPNPALMTEPYSNYSRPGASRPLVDKLLQSPYWHAEFEQVLTTIVKRFFKPSIVGPRLAAWAEMLQEDMAWDRSLAPKSPGTPTTWTVQEFKDNLNTTVQGTTGILEYVSARSAAVCQQLKITDQDDLPPLPPYTEGRYMDTSGNIKDSAHGGSITASTQGTQDSGSPMVHASSLWAVCIALCIGSIFL